MGPDFVEQKVGEEKETVLLFDLSTADPSGCDCQTCFATHSDPLPCFFGNCPERLRQSSKGRRPFHNEVPLS
jgi:hypothetical protein